MKILLLICLTVCGVIQLSQTVSAADVEDLDITMSVLDADDEQLKQAINRISLPGQASGKAIDHADKGLGVANADITKTIPNTAREQAQQMHTEAESLAEEAKEEAKQLRDTARDIMMEAREEAKSVRDEARSRSKQARDNARQNRNQTP